MEWRAVAGLPYEVSDSGIIRRTSAPNGRTRAGKIMACKPDGGGYLPVNLYDGRGGVRRTRVHVVVAEAFLGPRPPGCDVNHRNGRKTDNRAENLEWATRRENVQHAIDSGLGGHRRKTVLDDAEIASIRDRWLMGEKQAVLAVEYGIHVNSVWRYIHGRRRKGVGAA